jgi:hypothetical protein
MPSILQYVFNVSTRDLYIYHGEPGHVGMMHIGLSGLPAAIQLAKIHGVADFSVAYSKPDHKDDAVTRARIAGKFLGVEVPVLDHTWGEDAQVNGEAVQ